MLCYNFFFENDFFHFNFNSENESGIVNPLTITIDDTIEYDNINTLEEIEEKINEVINVSENAVTVPEISHKTVIEISEPVPSTSDGINKLDVDVEIPECVNELTNLSVVVGNDSGKDVFMDVTTTLPSIDLSVEEGWVRDGVIGFPSVTHSDKGENNAVTNDIIEFPLTDSEHELRFDSDEHIVQAPMEGLDILNEIITNDRMNNTTPVDYADISKSKRVAEIEHELLKQDFNNLTLTNNVESLDFDLFNFPPYSEDTIMEFDQS